MSAILSAVSLPYPETQEGFWGKPTSTINWCEEDYVVSYFAAEAVNTLTNLLFIAIGVRGVHNCIRFNYDTAFLVAYCGYLLVGCGSFAFHASLTCNRPQLTKIFILSNKSSRPNATFGRAIYDIHYIHPLLYDFQPFSINAILISTWFQSHTAFTLYHRTCLPKTPFVATDLF
ncbi:alkaline ceramidase YDC1 [Colletotrichum liriopes]|uniref:Alkaline ceramidase YDC1 n=1 Tax=Colletotrichum liriopes TaxID=708192 RepID=A0AA37LV04_9PEZI|nr:alkaline ceramidase YDC1 [Colletotrichum liriopes]